MTRPYFFEFSPLPIEELRHVLAESNAGRLDAKDAFRLWRKALDEEIADEGFRRFAG